MVRKMGQCVGMECGKVEWKAEDQEPQGQISFSWSPLLFSCLKRGNWVFPAVGQAAIWLRGLSHGKQHIWEDPLSLQFWASSTGSRVALVILPSFASQAPFPPFYHHGRCTWLFHPQSSKSSTKKLVFSSKGSHPTGPCHSTARNAWRRHVHAWRLEKGRCSVPSAIDTQAFPSCLSALKMATTFVCLLLQANEQIYQENHGGRTEILLRLAVFCFHCRFLWGGGLCSATLWIEMW